MSHTDSQLVTIIAVPDFCSAKTIAHAQNHDATNFVLSEYRNCNDRSQRRAAVGADVVQQFTGIFLQNRGGLLMPCSPGQTFA